VATVAVGSIGIILLRNIRRASGWPVCSLVTPPICWQALRVR